MRKIYNNIIVSFIMVVSLSLLLPSCNKDENEISSEGEGCLVMKLELTSTKSTTDDYSAILENSTLKIYTEYGTLIRRYEPATEVESNIYLVSGVYKAVLTAGFETSATFDKDERKFYGEQEFTMEAQKTTELTINCTMVNTVVTVSYDETIASTFDLGSIAYVSLSDTFSKDDAVNNSVPTLVYSEDNTGYFLMPDETSNLSWGFYAESSNEDIGELSKEGVIELPQSATQYTINFKYSKTPDGYMDLNITVDDSAVEFDDIMSFSPQPTVTGSNFDASEEIEYVDQILMYNVTGLKDLTKIEVTGTDVISGNTFSYIPFENSTVQDTESDGISVVVTDSKNLLLTFSSELFKNFNSGGSQIITVYTTDNAGSRGVATLKFKVTGVESISSCDYWNNSGILNAYVTDPNASNVVLSYRRDGANDWIDLPATKSGENIYSANISATWSSSTNSGGLTIYTLNSGITANSTFETKLTINQDEYLPLELSTDGGQTIPYADMEDSNLSCWGSSNSSTTNWGSGNNSMASSLCSQGTRTGMGGSSCAYLSGSSVLLVDLAAGNLFLGQFSQSGTNGTVSFGQSYDWESRPNTFKLKYSATIGTVDANYHSGPLSKGDSDIARIFLAIVDWSGRHGVKTGTGDPSGIWNPSTQSSTDEGEIIGYAFYDITASTATEMQTLELPVYYYNTTTKPSKDITIVISCATSAYGDYLNGSTSSKLWVDDFEFGY